MKTSILFILVLLGAAGSPCFSQPQTMASLFSSDFVGDIIDINGTVYFTGTAYLQRTNADHTNVEFIEVLYGEGVNLKNVNGILYFTMYREGYGQEASVWRSDGTSAGTRPFKIFPNTFNQISPLANIGSNVYFGFQDQLYQSDGTASGTVMVKDLGTDSNDGFLRLAEMEGKIFISFRRKSGQYDLWVTNGTPSGTNFIRSFRYLEWLRAAGNNLYFIGDDGTTGNELWKLTQDGNTTLVRDLNSGGGSLTPGMTLTAEWKDELIFTTTTPSATWKTSGTAGSTVQIVPFAADELAVTPGFIMLIRQNELWKSDGNLAESVRVFSDATGGRPLANLTVHNHTLFFTVNGLQLWETDGTADGTILITEHETRAASSRLISSGRYLYQFVGFAYVYGTYFQEDAALVKYEPSSLWIRNLSLVDAAADNDIRVLRDNDVISVDQDISVRAEASSATASVRFSVNGAAYRRETRRPFAIAGDNSGDYNPWPAAPGTYTITATPYSAAGIAGKPLTYTVTVTGSCAAGMIVREYWNNIPGSKVSLIPLHQAPARTDTLTLFEGPLNQGTNYGARVRAYICPPVSGNYTFWIASNDQSELWLSTDENPVNKQRVAYVSGATASREWTKYPSQRSQIVALVAGRRYYIESLHKQGLGADHVAVGWQLPGGALERPIPATRLSPFNAQGLVEVFITDPADGKEFIAPATVNLGVVFRNLDTDLDLFYYAGQNLIQTQNSQDARGFTWTNVSAGIYPLRVVGCNVAGDTISSRVVTITVREQCTASGKIVREFWTGVPGNRVSDIPVNARPTGTMELALFESPLNAGMNYGARIRGYICPPGTGKYTFWIASNDHSELWLSSDDKAINRKRIAYVNGATAPRQWDKYTTQRSAEVSLVEGKKYYIEALHKQGAGTDNLAVGWRLSDGTMERPIAGSRLSPYDPAAIGVSWIQYPADGASGVDPLIVKLKLRPLLGARRYTVQISKRNDFGDSPVTLNSVEDHQTRFIVRELQPSVTYYLRVKTDVSGFGPVSAFTTRDAIPRKRLWGLTTTGGAADLGTLFSFSIDSGTFLKHHDKEQFPEAFDTFWGTLVAGPDGVFYGHSEHAYAFNGFTMTQEGKLEWWSSIWFREMMLASNNYLYGNSTSGIGYVVKIDADNSAHNLTIRTFDPRSNGVRPSASLLEGDDGYLYGITREGGFNEGGVVYKMNYNGSDFEVLHYFDHTAGGMNPYSGLTVSGEILYGTTARGGEVEETGTIFSIRRNGSNFKKLHDFDGRNGRHPVGELIFIDRVLYGMTTRGGDHDLGAVYRINSDGSEFRVLHEFSGEDGAYPSGALSHDGAGNLYGMTSEGGANGLGVLFKITTEGAFEKLFDFTTESGGAPNGSLIIREDTFTPNATEAEASSNLNVSIYPNPFTNNFQVHVQSARREPIHLVVTDQYGQRVGVFEINPNIPMQIGSELKRGLFIIEIIQGRVIEMKRIVKR